MTAAKKSIKDIFFNVATEPGLAMIAAHVMLSAAAGGKALAVAATTLATATALKVSKETGLVDKIKNIKLRNIFNNQNTPMRLAGIGLTGLSALSFASDQPLLGFAFAMFASGNMMFNTPLMKKLPMDNVMFMLGSCTTAYLAGGSMLPWLAIVPASILSTYNVMKPSGDRNLGRPKLWFALGQGASGILGLASGEPEKFLPAMAMFSVLWGYTMMEQRSAGLPFMTKEKDETTHDSPPQEPPSRSSHNNFQPS